jgi:hypothetical protein
MSAFRTTESAGEPDPTPLKEQDDNIPDTLTVPKCGIMDATKTLADEERHQVKELSEATIPCSHA